MANPKRGDTTRLQQLLAGFTSDPRTSPAAATHSRQLYNLLTQRNTVAFGGHLAEPWRGLRFGVNVLLITLREREWWGFLQLHRKMPKALPPGGEIDPTDHGDVLQTGLRELLQETGDDKNVESSPLYPFQHTLKWLAQPVLDVHTMQSIVPGKPQPWWFLTLGLVAGPQQAELVENSGRYYRLSNIARVEDPSLARAARHAQLACAET